MARKTTFFIPHNKNQRPAVGKRKENLVGTSDAGSCIQQSSPGFSTSSSASPAGPPARRAPGGCTTPTVPQQKARAVEMERSEQKLNQSSESIMELKGIFTVLVLNRRWMPRRYGREELGSQADHRLPADISESLLQSRKQGTDLRLDSTHAQHLLMSNLIGTLRIRSKTSACPEHVWLCTLRPIPSEMQLNCKRALPNTDT